MATEKRVSGMTVGMLLSEEQYNAILETRERRKQLAQSSASKRSGTSSKQSGEESGSQQSKG